ncbi:MAG: right-handed parallel beta-helix repeat-containing protein [Gemmatimonadota bacterium]
MAVIDVDAPSTRLLMDGTLQITAVPRDADGADMTSIDVSWHSANTSIATVDDDGLVQGVDYGTTDVIVAAGTLERSLSVEVVPRPVSCAAAGTTATDVADSVMWRTADGPFHMQQTVVVNGQLVIESGALVCGAQDAVLQIGTTLGGGSLLSHGAEGDTIVLTAADPDRPWGGILAEHAHEVDLRFVRLEAALNGISSTVAGQIVVEDARISRISGVGIALRHTDSVSRTTIDGAGTGISIDYGSPVELREVIVRNSTGTGIRLWRSRVGLYDVRVEDSGGDGIVFDGLTGIGPIGATDLVVTGSVGAGVRISAFDLTLSGCTITGGAADGVVLTDGSGVAVHGCNLSGNAGVGVRNPTSFFSVDASLNWWGDPAGPDGPNGDGVSGDVLVMPVLTEPVSANRSASESGTQR